MIPRIALYGGHLHCQSTLEHIIFQYQRYKCSLVNSKILMTTIELDNFCIVCNNCALKFQNLNLNENLVFFVLMNWH